MTDKRLLSEKKLDDLHLLVQEHKKEGFTPEHYQYLRSDLSYSAPGLLEHIQAQAERIEELEAMLNAQEECVSCGEVRLERDLTDGVCPECVAEKSDD